MNSEKNSTPLSQNSFIISFEQVVLLLYGEPSALMKLLVYFVSDHTGITVESLGRTLLSQFEFDEASYKTRPYIDTIEKAQELIASIETNESEHLIIFSSLSDQNITQVFSKSDFQHIDIFAEFLPRLEGMLNQKASGEAGLAHSAKNYNKYMMRIEAINFALAHDDGLNSKYYEKADILLIGVSRSGKTPTCLYMAIQFGIEAANYPITEEDWNGGILPTVLQPQKQKLFGLLIDPKRLHEIRSERLPNSRYASLQQCRLELSRIKELYQKNNIPFLDTTSLSIEEISTQILLKTDIEKRF